MCDLPAMSLLATTRRWKSSAKESTLKKAIEVREECYPQDVFFLFLFLWQFLCDSRRERLKLGFPSGRVSTSGLLSKGAGKRGGWKQGCHLDHTVAFMGRGVRNAITALG